MKDMRINGQRKLCPHPSSKPPLHSAAKKKIPRHEDRSLSDQMTHYLGPRISAIREQSSHFPIVSLLGIFAAQRMPWKLMEKTTWLDPKMYSSTQVFSLHFGRDDQHDSTSQHARIFHPYLKRIERPQRTLGSGGVNSTGHIDCWLPCLTMIDVLWKFEKG